MPIQTFQGVKNLNVPIHRVTHGQLHHWFGYYDKCPWDATGRYVLAMRNSFCDRQPAPGMDEQITIGMADLQDDDRYIELDTTSAWCWQQGTMLQWLGDAADQRIIYNVVAPGDEDHYAARVRDVHSGETRDLPGPVYAVSRDGTHAVCNDFDRVNRTRPGYGYGALPEHNAHVSAPADMGVHHMDLASGMRRQLISIKWLANNEPRDGFDAAQHWVNHLELNPAGDRFLFLHRWDGGSQYIRATRMYTARPDGTDVRLILDADLTSHFCWRDDRTILVWSKAKREDPAGRYIFVDAITGTVQDVGGEIPAQDGHCTISPDGRWILTDTYPDAESYRTLILFRIADGKRFDVGSFFSPPAVTGDWRCDLHPRFNRDGTQVCIDSAHEPTRHVYVLDVAQMVD